MNLEVGLGKEQHYSSRDKCTTAGKSAGAWRGVVSELLVTANIKQPSCLVFRCRCERVPAVVVLRTLYAQIISIIILIIIIIIISGETLMT